MDPNAVVLEISSDEEVGLDDYDLRAIADGDDDHEWIAELLYEVNKDDRDYDDGGDDSDEVVVVSEVLPSKKPRNKLTSKSSPLIDVDDDCVVLDHDPDKPAEVRNDSPVDRDEDDDADDLVVVSEKGQVACRDYPHPRHLCIKFPFLSTPNESHCDQCYCYVCDSLAPCVYWGNGSATMDHCHATEKDDFWKLERQNSKNGINKGVEPQPVPKVADTSLSNWLPPMNLLPPAPVFVQTPSVVHHQVPRPPIRPCPVSSGFGVPSITSEIQSPFFLPRNKYHPDLVSQQLVRLRTSSGTNSRDRWQHNYNLGTPFRRPVFKPPVNRYSYSSYRGDYRNPHQRQGYLSNEMLSGTSGSFSPPNVTFEEPLSSLPEFPHQPNSNASFDLSPNYPPQINVDSYVETPVPFRPHSAFVSSQPQGQYSVSNYSVPTEPSQQGQRSTIDPKNFHDISWPQSSVLEGTAPANDSSLATVSGGLVEYPYDDWIYEDQPSTDIAGSFCPEPAYVEAGTIFDL